MMDSPVTLLATPAMPLPMTAPVVAADPACKPPGRGCVKRLCSNPAAAACADGLIGIPPACPLPGTPFMEGGAPPGKPGGAPPEKPWGGAPGTVGCVADPDPINPPPVSPPINP